MHHIAYILFQTGKGRKTTGNKQTKKKKKTPFLGHCEEIEKNVNSYSLVIVLLQTKFGFVHVI